ncbi:MAG TPA: hypothetical protein VGZ22_08720 [Isosphaeraceae bacterium]|jgi:hypothetical protein|nr:hypothetical protein [Isosphaeraceae bacterium]
MCSENRRLANQRNALKSTGPKTVEGKAKSRQNSLKHGLTGAGVVQSENDRRAIKERVAAWNAKFAPIDSTEACLVARAATASIRLERCVDAELADLASRRRRASQRWEARQRKVVSGLLRRMESDPLEVVRELQTLTTGCDWLLGQWQRLDNTLESRGGWSIDEAEHVLRLLGHEPEAPYPGNERVAALRAHLLATLVEDGNERQDDVDEADDSTEPPQKARVDEDHEARSGSPSRAPERAPAYSPGRELQVGPDWSEVPGPGAPGFAPPLAGLNSPSRAPEGAKAYSLGREPQVGAAVSDGGGVPGAHAPGFTPPPLAGLSQNEPSNAEPAGIDRGTHLARIGLDFEALSPLPSPEDAREGLKALAASELARLQARRDEVWTKQDAPDHAEAQARILVDRSPQGYQLFRIEASTESRMHRSLDKLIRFRKMEPDYATLKRFEIKGEHPSRVWDGVDWMSWSQFAGTSDERPSDSDDPREPAAEPAAAAVSIVEVSSPAWGPRPPVAVAKNEPIKPAINPYSTKTSVDNQGRSRTAPEPRPQPLPPSYAGCVSLIPRPRPQTQDPTRSDPAP